MKNDEVLCIKPFIISEGIAKINGINVNDTILFRANTIYKYKMPPGVFTYYEYFVSYGDHVRDTYSFTKNEFEKYFKTMADVRADKLNQII